MWQGLSRFHQQQGNKLSNLMSNMQQQQQPNRRQAQGFGVPLNPSFPRQTNRQMNRPQMNTNRGQQQNYNGSQSSQMGGNGYNQRMNILNHLKTLQERHRREFHSNNVSFKDITNFNNSQDLCVQMEVQVKVNDQTKTIVLKLGPRFPIEPPQFRFKQILIHPVIQRETNNIMLEKVTSYNRTMNTSSILQKLEEYFRNSPPTNSPELEKLLEEIMDLNQSIHSLKNIDYAAFIFHLNPVVKSTISNGNYECLKDSSEFKRTMAKMRNLAESLQSLKNQVAHAQSQLEEMNADNSELLENHKLKVDELHDLNFSMSQLRQRFDEENVKKFLNSSVNQMNEKKEQLREKMMECELEELHGLQEEYLKASCVMNKHLTLLDKAFAY